MVKREESGKSKERTNLSYTLSAKARERIEEIVEKMPRELDANLSNIQEAIMMAYLKSNIAPQDCILAARLLKKLRRGELNTK